MPKLGKIYYYSPVPPDLLQLIGQYAGDINRPLLFTLTPKHKYLGSIYVKSPYKRYRLTLDSWVPKRLGQVSDATRIQRYLMDRLTHNLFFVGGDGTYVKDLTRVMTKFAIALTEIRNYSLK